MGTLRPEGDEPFELPLAQQADAFQNGELVTLSFKVSFNGGRLQKVRIELSKNQAVAFLGELRKAVVGPIET